MQVVPVLEICRYVHLVLGLSLATSVIARPAFCVLLAHLSNVIIAL